ncbi:heterokaryon incompatibility protein-domain-containing protein [Dichomitus squalens]|uniref:Heterokaryon incompatibility protein-domain-containing protein n=3 Tax=Dichomitus squalens TaxID=114155 RepID=A0A4Q9PU25_9APHY|nr:heterokaryon incompatibility protein-domain-containing protein [Dichomitus squalens]
MWLLNTKTAELKFFHTPSDLRYAILSHCWRDHEQTFQELQTLRAQHFSPDGTPRSRVSAKIRQCCIYAERAGFEWVWVDTCCIDKTSSAELSEAINSMYAWYAHAAVCYAFLDDTRDNENPSTPRSSFRKSRWWTRGWTLQELIAPKVVIFLSKSWRFIGTKHSLASLVEEISGIDRGVLVHERALDDISVARRMSWAARRHTTREEDRAYSLMGIFGVNLPTIYGEGPRAFLRLQEEILKHIPDQSIFAWGAILDDYPFACKGFSTDSEDQHWPSSYTGVSPTDMQTLLAPSPVEFAAAGRIRPIHVADLYRRLGLQQDEIAGPHYHITSYGIRIPLPFIPYEPNSGLSLTAPANVSIAVLSCEHEDGSLVLLFLRRKQNTLGEYYVGDFVDVGDSAEIFTRAYFRVAFLSKSAPNLSSPTIVRDVYIHNRVHPAMRIHLPHRTLADTEHIERINYSFFFPEWVLSRLQTVGGFVPQDKRAGDDGLTLDMPVLPGLDVSAVFHLTRVTQAVFAQPDNERGGFVVTFGIGCICQLTHKRRGFDAFWVEVAHAPLSANQRQLRQKWSAALGPSGGCARRHLKHAPMDFADARGTVRLTVTPWGGSPAGAAARDFSYVVDVELLEPDEGGAAGPASPVEQPSSTRATLRRAVELLWSLRLGSI